MTYNHNTQRPKYKRAESPPPMRFQERDLEIIKAIHQYDGVLARRHIKTMFWEDKSTQAMETRLSKLYHNGYLDWPNEDHRRYRPIPEPLIWIGWKGVIEIAREKGIEVRIPTSDNENQMRLLQTELRKYGIRWMREPNWNQPHHDLTVVDFRLAVDRSVSEIPKLTLVQWIPESLFRSNTDRISFSFKGNNGKFRQKKKGVCPDGFFVLVDEKRKQNFQPYKARFLLEIDMATHDNPSFGIEKAAAGVAYIKSNAYKARFGANAGRWLVVTKSDTRMKNLMRQTKRRVENNAHLFYFTTLDQLSNCNVLISPIWWQVDLNEPQALPLSR
ncbi:MAG: replication-relaxation family protein [Anaerolineales bacterium]|jgi:hypothetical protein